jgi:hypothetical protein
MGRSLIILLLPTLLSLSLSVGATRNDLLPLRKPENNEDDDSLTLQDVLQQNAVLLLPNKKENEMMRIEVPELLGVPRDEDQLPTGTLNRLSLLPHAREGKRDYIFDPREGEGDSILRPRRGGVDFNFLRERRNLRFGHPGAGCHQHRHNHGGEMKFRHFREDGPRFRPQFPRSNSFPSSDGLGEESVSSSFGSFSEESLPLAENKESWFQPRERAFERVGEKPVFPEREQTHAHGRHGQGEGEFQNGEEHKDERHEVPAAPWMDWLRSLLDHP